MDTLQQMLFEDPIVLYVLLGVAAAAVGFIWFQRRDRRLVRWLVTFAMLAGALVLCDLLVRTDREQIMDAAKAVIREINAGRVQGVAPYLADGFGGDAYADKQAALRDAERAVANYRPYVIDMLNPRLSITGRRARMPVTLLVRLDAGDLAGQHLSLAWEIRWVKITRDGELVWLIEDAARARGGD